MTVVPSGATAKLAYTSDFLSFFLFCLLKTVSQRLSSRTTGLLNRATDDASLREFWKKILLHCHMAVFAGKTWRLRSIFLLDDPMRVKDEVCAMCHCDLFSHDDALVSLFVCFVVVLIEYLQVWQTDGNGMLSSNLKITGELLCEECVYELQLGVCPSPLLLLLSLSWLKCCFPFRTQE